MAIRNMKLTALGNSEDLTRLYASVFSREPNHPESFGLDLDKIIPVVNQLDGNECEDAWGVTANTDCRCCGTIVESQYSPGGFSLSCSVDTIDEVPTPVLQKLSIDWPEIQFRLIDFERVFGTATESWFVHGKLARRELHCGKVLWLEFGYEIDDFPFAEERGCRLSDPYVPFALKEAADHVFPLWLASFGPSDHSERFEKIGKAILELSSYPQ